MRHLTYRGARERWGESLPDSVKERLDYELEVIGGMGFSSYFLIVWDLIRYAREQDIRVGPGRGSAAGCAVAYCLRITDLDPIKYDLIFERFLNPSRISMPDIDMDFDSRYRDQMIRYAADKYGRDHVAQIITFGTLAARAAIKDVGRALDMTFGDVDKITKLVPTQPLNIKLAEARKMEPQIDALAAQDPRIKEVLEVAERLEGMARNAGVHAAGVVISPVPLKEIVPLYKTNKDEVVTQYDGVILEKLSLLKMDFLGLTTLTIIADALKLIKRHRGVEIAIEDLDLSERPRNCLKRAQVNTIGELLSKTEDDLLNITNFGQKSLDEVKQKLDERGLSLRG